MEARHGYLTQRQLDRLERMSLEGYEAHVRDAFLFCCWTGLRISDFLTLENTHVSGGWIKKKMIKTGYVVEVPLQRIFRGKAAAMILRYGTVEKLTQGLKQNSTINKTLHTLTDRLKPDFRCTFHTSRHTFATLLAQQGVPMTAIQQMLGHRKMETTQIYGERDRRTLENQLDGVRKLKKKRKNETNLEENPNTVPTTLEAG